MKDLSTVIADWRSQANVLRSRGHAREASIIDELLDEVRAASGPHLDWLSEDEAMLASGRCRAFFRTRFPEWETRDMARLEGRRRRYRACVVPRRANLDTAREAAKRAAKESAA